MISYLSGKIEFKSDKFIIINTDRVGYKVFCSPQTLEMILKDDSEIKIFTHLVLREGATIELYGFLNYDELDLFEKLLTVSGIGPRAALNLASFGSVGELKEALSSGKKVISGIGPKKVQKILLELGESSSGKNPVFFAGGKKSESQKKNDAIEALVNLGVLRQKAREIISEIPEEMGDAENIVKEALRRFGK